jgi:membrane associated rhomboid family serine protease
MHDLPPITRNLLLANIAVFALDALGFRDLLMSWFALWPLTGPFAPWQLVSYSFLHSDFLHLFFNMFGVYMFGGTLEQTLGPKRYLTLYFGAVIVAALLQTIVTRYFSPSPWPTVGASGGLFGMLTAFALLFPQRELQLLFPPIPIRAWLFVTLYGIAELWLGFSRAATGIAHFAHLGGMLGGFLVVQHYRKISRLR